MEITFCRWKKSKKSCLCLSYQPYDVCSWMKRRTEPNIIPIRWSIKKFFKSQWTQNIHFKLRIKKEKKLHEYAWKERICHLPFATLFSSLFCFGCIQSCTAPLFFYILIHRLILYLLPSNDFSYFYGLFSLICSSIRCSWHWKFDVMCASGNALDRWKQKKTRFSFLYSVMRFGMVFSKWFFYKLYAMAFGSFFIWNSKVELNIMHAHSHMNTAVGWCNPMRLLCEYDGEKNCRQMMNFTHRKNKAECMHVFWNRLSMLLWLGVPSWY